MGGTGLLGKTYGVPSSFTTIRHLARLFHPAFLLSSFSPVAQTKGASPRQQNNQRRIGVIGFIADIDTATCLTFRNPPNFRFRRIRCPFSITIVTSAQAVAQSCRRSHAFYYAGVL